MSPVRWLGTSRRRGWSYRRIEQVRTAGVALQPVIERGHRTICTIRTARQTARKHLIAMPRSNRRPRTVAAAALLCLGAQVATATSLSSKDRSKVYDVMTQISTQSYVLFGSSAL